MHAPSEEVSDFFPTEPSESSEGDFPTDSEPDGDPILADERPDALPDESQD